MMVAGLWSSHRMLCISGTSWPTNRLTYTSTLSWGAPSSSSSSTWWCNVPHDLQSIRPEHGRFLSFATTTRHLNGTLGAADALLWPKALRRHGHWTESHGQEWQKRTLNRSKLRKDSSFLDKKVGSAELLTTQMCSFNCRFDKISSKRTTGFIWDILMENKQQVMTDRRIHM